MKFFLYNAALILSLSSTIASAIEYIPANNPSLSLKLDGIFNFQSGFLSQGKLQGNEKLVSANRKGFAFYTESYFGVTVQQTLDSIVYGAKIALIPTSKLKTSSSINGSHLFLESEFGKVEIGSPHDAGSKMRIVADDIAAGGDWSGYSVLDGAYIQYQGLPAELIYYKEYFFDSIFRTKLNEINDKAEPSRKVSYYTPNYNGFRLGISYIPDSGNAGSSNPSPSSSGTINMKIPNTVNSYIINRNVKDAVSLGLSYDHNISDGIDLKLAITGEYGKAAGNIKLIENAGLPNEITVDQYKLSNLKTYNLGAILNYGVFSYGGSYGTLNKSLTSGNFNKTGRDTRYYNGAVAYNQGPVKVSLSYFKSNQYKNKLDALSLGSEYKLAPGLLPYAEISHFRAKGRPSFYPEAPIKKIKGTVFVLGAKLKF